MTDDNTLCNNQVTFVRETRSITNIKAYLMLFVYIIEQDWVTQF